MKKNRQKGIPPRRKSAHFSIRWALVFYDVICYIVFAILFLRVYSTDGLHLPWPDVWKQMLNGFISIFGFRFLLNVYRQIWRYGSLVAYLRLILADTLGGLLFVILRSLPYAEEVRFSIVAALAAVNLLAALSLRIIYQYVYQNARGTSEPEKVLRSLVRVFGGVDMDLDLENGRTTRIKIAILGAGRVGVMLADELLNNSHAAYRPVCFVDSSKEKIGRQMYSLPVLDERDITKETLAAMGIQEVVFAVPSMTAERKMELYEHYQSMGCRVKVYDFPVAQSVESGKRRHLRSFDVEELLFRRPIEISDDRTDYYRDKVVLISGGGGSIGSELSRQIAAMHPKKLVLLDIYENGVYDVQQELRIEYGQELDLAVEICSVCDREQLRKVFSVHRPDVVLHAAAHKHVPLMEHNCCEAVWNNVFGTLNMVEVSEEFAVSKFTMISTDKAVNPTNVMGATKRMCEMIVLSRPAGKTLFSATRFGNVLGSNGSVIPLFRRQIAKGGPVTLTDKRIIRYFMTIPEASQLVLQSSAMAKNGELYVLDMGKPVRILDLAENMIRLSGFEPYTDIDIVETGLRPGEKLYEELLIKTEELDKTENDLLFIEREIPPALSEVQEKLEVLRAVLPTQDDDAMRDALMQVVPTYHRPEVVNEAAVHAQEMKDAAER